MNENSVKSWQLDKAATHTLQLETQSAIDTLLATHSGGEIPSPEAYAKLLKSSASLANYHHLSPQFSAALLALREVGPALAQLYNKLLALHYLVHLRLADCCYELPECIAALYELDKQRIFDQLCRNKLSFYDFDNEEFVKDLGILTHRLIPVGSQYAQPQSRLQWNIMATQGGRQLVRSVAFITRRAGRTQPFLDVHTHTLNLSEFNQAGWDKTYCRMAELMRLNPGIQGWQGVGWFFDPALATVSPRLDYLRKATQFGAANLFAKWLTDSTGGGALSTSKTRRALCTAGDYKPAAYMLVWGRRDLLRWHQAHKHAVPL